MARDAIHALDTNDLAAEFLDDVGLLSIFRLRRDEDVRHDVDRGQRVGQLRRERITKAGHACHQVGAFLLAMANGVLQPVSLQLATDSGQRWRDTAILTDAGVVRAEVILVPTDRIDVTATVACEAIA
ncbi:MAG TPA: hypothetical protein EYP98_10465 [Planctomycetes bacterium]|nr:hypothetical protein [Planctomycetota bacterium]